MKNWILTFLTISATFCCYGQNLKTIGYKQLADEIFSSNKEKLFYKNIHFINDLPDKGAESFITTYVNGGAPWTVFGGFKRYLDSKGIDKDSTGLFYSNCNLIEFEECNFDNDIRFSNVKFNGSVSFTNCDFPTISEDYVGLYGQVFGGAVLIDSCQFIGRFELKVRKETSYRFFFKFNHSVSNWFKVELQKSTSQIKQSNFLKESSIQIHGESGIQVDSAHFGNLRLELDNTNWISISNSLIRDSTNNFSSFYLNTGSIILSDNYFDANIQLSFEKALIDFRKNNFCKKLVLDFNEIEKASYVNLISLKNLDIGIFSNDSYYNATTREQVNDDFNFKKYLTQKSQVEFDL
jgi:hypothetical protein